MLESYSWYEQDFTAFLLSLNLPAYRKNIPISKILDNEKKDFVRKFKNMIDLKRFRGFSDTFYDSLKKLLPRINVLFKELIDIIELYNNSDLAAAQHKFDNMMDSLRDYIFINQIGMDNGQNVFYRIRVSPNDKLKKRQDLFHIPYKKRHLASNERYSLAGHPCLYLSSQLYIAWQECGYPHSFYYSMFQYQPGSKQNEWRFITFISPPKIASSYFVAINESEEKYLKIANSIILTYPLMFACSIVNPNGISSFKQEYIIPQMLTQWVYRHYDIIQGIIYFSCCGADDNYIYTGYNIVIPVKNIDSRSGFGKDLLKKFKVTIPVYIEYKLYKDEIKIVNLYKNDLLNVMHETFRESNECLYDLYLLTDLLDKAIRNASNSDMQFVISAVRNVKKSGQILISKYNKQKIIEKARSSINYSYLTEKKIKDFSDIFDRFQQDVLNIADKYDMLFYNKQSNIDYEFIS